MVVLFHKMVEFISLEELQTKLNLRDRRSVRRWCEERAIPLIRMGKRAVAPRIHVDIELMKPLVISLRNSYGEQWKEYFLMYLKNDLVEFADMAFPENIKPPSTTKYLPKSKVEQDFLNEILNL